MESLKSENHYDKFFKVFEAVCGENFHVGYYQHEKESLRIANTALSDKLATATKLRSGEKVIDIGCGIGGPARYIAQNFDVKVTGISNSSESISRACENATTGTSFVCLDALHLELQGFSDFDVAWLMESSHLMEDKARLFGNIKSVIHGAGRFVLCDFFLKAENAAQNKSNLYKMRHIFKAFGKLKLVTTKSYVESASQAGFTSIRIEDVSKAVMPTFADWAEKARSFASKSGEFEEFAIAAECLGDLFREEVLTYNIIEGYKQ